MTVQQSVFVMRQKADRALHRLCGRKFSGREYENIVGCYLILDRMEEVLGVQLVDMSQITTNDDSIVEVQDSFPCLEGLPDRVQRFQEEDVRACLRSAVLEFIYASQEHKVHMDSAFGGAQGETGASGRHVLLYDGMGISDESMLELEDVHLSELYSRVLAYFMVPCVVRTCELLIDVVHTHYLVTQWHLAPFHPHNGESEWLHRSPIDLQETANSTSWGYEVTLGESTTATTNHDSNTTDQTTLAAKSEQEHEDQYNEGCKDDSTPVLSPAFSPQARSVSGLLNSLRFPASTLPAKIREAMQNSFYEHFQCPPLRSAVSDNAEVEETQQRRMHLQSLQLISCYQALCSGRSSLWEVVVNALEDVLGLTVLSASVSQADFYT